MVGEPTKPEKPSEAGSGLGEPQSVGPRKGRERSFLLFSEANGETFKRAIWDIKQAEESMRALYGDFLKSQGLTPEEVQAELDRSLGDWYDKAAGQTGAPTHSSLPKTPIGTPLSSKPPKP